MLQYSKGAKRMFRISSESWVDWTNSKRPKDSHGVGSRPGASSAMSPPLSLWTCRRVPSKLEHSSFPPSNEEATYMILYPWYIPLSDVNPIKSMKVPIKLLASYSVIPASRYAFLLVDLFPNTRPGQPCPARTTSPHGACRIKVRPSSQVIVRY